MIRILTHLGPFPRHTSQPKGFPHSQTFLSLSLPSQKPTLKRIIWNTDLPEFAEGQSSGEKKNRLLTSGPLADLPSFPEPPGTGWLQDPRHCPSDLTPLFLASGRLSFLLSPPGSPMDAVCSLVNVEGNQRHLDTQGTLREGALGGGHMPLGSGELARGWLSS